MSALVLYFHVHQPHRIRHFDAFKINSDLDYFSAQKTDRLKNEAIFRKVAAKCYIPTNQVLLKLLQQHQEFKCSFSISGVFIDQMRAYMPELIDSFRQLVDTGKVEILAETYYHSLSFLKSETEFVEQITQHHQEIQSVFGVSPRAFRNTELIYNNHIAKIAEDLGYKTILAEGIERYLGWRSPNFVYQPAGTENIRLLLKNYKLSDDIAFRFSQRSWEEWPLTIEKYTQWLNAINGSGQVINLFMDYETFGEHQWADSGIFEFLEHLPSEFLKHPDNTFMNVTEAAYSFPVSDVVDMPELTSWADIERDLSAWVSNPLQQHALDTLYSLESSIKHAQDPKLLQDWRKLTTSDHFYYMCTKWFADGDVHKYFSPNESPYEAYVHFMNVLHDLSQRVYAGTRKEKHGHIHSISLLTT